LHDTAVRNVRAIDPALGDYLPHFLHLLSIPSALYPLPDHVEGEAFRLALQEALTAMIIRSATQKPMVLILEDWHWVDEASDAALTPMLSMSSAYPLLLVVLYRPEYNATWGHLTHSTAMNLSGLTEAETGRIAGAVMGAERLPAGLEALIHERTGGNPFFVEEVCAALLEDKTVVVQGGQAVLSRPPETLDLPDTVQAVIRTRLDRLESQSQQVLRLAAVIGREFTRRILERIATCPTAIASTLETVKTADLIQQIQLLPEAEYMFKHALTQVVVYETLLLQQRKELHGLVAHAIEDLYADRLEEQVEILAYHYSRSDERNKGVHYLKHSGSKAVETCSYAAARKHYQSVVALLSSMQQTPECLSDQIEMTLKWSNAAFSSPTLELLSASKRCLDQARDLQDDHLTMRLSRHVGYQQILLGELEGHSLLIRCLELANALKDEWYIASAMDTIGRGLFHTVKHASGIEYLEKSITIVNRMGNHMEASFSYGYLALCQGYSGRSSQARESGEHALAIATQIDHLACKMFANYCLGMLEATYGNWKDTVSRMTPNIELSVRVDFPIQISEGKFALGLAMYHLEEREEGIALMREGIEHLEPVGSRCWMPFLPKLYGKLAYICARTNRRDEAETLLNKALALDFPTNWGRIYVNWAAALSCVNRPAPDWSEAVNHMEKSIHLAKTLGLRPDLAQCYLHHAELLRDKGDFGQARAYLTQAAALFTEMEMTWWLEQAGALEKELGAE
jgi:predicted ATPase